VTDSENFISRWARLKQRNEATVAQPRPDSPAEEPFDPASLPSIESIVADTDITGFLQSRVPAELRRAALRQAWTSDPAIRDFIGIAENQWDFNDPTAMPGFGPMLEGDRLPELLAQALGGRNKLAALISEMPVSSVESLPGATDHELATAGQNEQRTFDDSPPAERVAALPDTSGGQDGTAGHEDVAEQDNPPRRRSHGSASPR
jgi:Protein of unknown function (DUF3306)